MIWDIEFFNDSVEEAILDMPPKIQARMLKLLELRKAEVERNEHPKFKK
jgi:hypothetical protein